MCIRDRQLDSENRQNNVLHNEKHAIIILNIIISCICFCGAFELALQGHNETESSSDPGVFREMCIRDR